MTKCAHEKANCKKRKINSKRGSPVFQKKGPRGPRRPSVGGLQVTAGDSGPRMGTGTASSVASGSGQDKGSRHRPQ